MCTVEDVYRTDVHMLYSRSVHCNVLFQNIEALLVMESRIYKDDFRGAV